MATPAPRDLQNDLRPSVDTSFFYYEAFNVLDSYTLDWIDHDSHKTKWGDTVTWNAEAYIYGVGAKPFIVDEQGETVVNPSFKAEGGEIIMLFAHSGKINLGDVQGHHIEYVQEVVSLYKKAVASGQYPETNNYTQNGSNYTYTASFEQTMPMYKNNGNEPYQFPAQYKNIFVLAKAKQSSDIALNAIAQFAIRTDGNHSSGTSYPINGLSVFKTSDLSVFPLEFNFNHNIHGHYEQSNGSEDVWSNAPSFTYTVKLDNLKP